ncbi:GDSL-type esterase/lipase family protein [Psychrobacillus psychrodurans]|uniref:GDSL-type esterase/lipase family protein n=1 Tax=Psychrobacillus TaxID=1221880 RepID=UPI0008F3D8DC|nr:GDSL-type esterase/lipase family protein [Psychrobacillus psychrodurans]MCK1998804.1 GDSL-type esterase/lipase family protein [Psychrobacillus psychrodurans]MCZ8539942.1 GDSL-type esterase/lipase family protein [Psychrobacillus psychrodurans]SFM53758.1 Lysophospholipase L1 [Psychrobacillus psychrodurans]
MKYLLIVISVIFLVGCNSNDLVEVSFSEKQEVLFEDYVIPFKFFPRTIEVVGLGDSLTQGVGDELKREGYLGRLQQHFSQYKGIEDVPLTNTAKRGRRSDQLLKMLKDGEIDHQIRKAHIITLTIGGNDIMKVVKKDLFNLKVEAFEKELGKFERNYDQIIQEIREINSTAPIIIMGLYNPITIVTDEKSEFDLILNDWNETIQEIAYSDSNACYVPIDHLFVTNTNLVYHTDFFHPNSKGYQLVIEEIISSMQECGLIDADSRELLF